MLNSYSDYYYKTYITRGWTYTHLLCLFLVYLIIALPFYFSFAGKPFWLDVQSRQITTTYNHTGYYAVQVNYQDTTSNFITHEYSNVPGNAMTSSSGFSASVTANDLSTTGSITIALSGYNGMEILAVNLILYYRVQFQELQKGQLCGLMLTVPGNLIQASLAGTLQYISSKPISAILSGSTLNLPPYYPNMVGGFSYSTLASQLISKSLLLGYQPLSQIITDTAINSPSSRNIDISYSKGRSVMVNYYPSILQTLKFNYSTYLAFAIIFYYIFTTVFKHFVNEGLLDCQAVTEQLRP